MKLFSKNLLLINFLLIFMIREKLNSHVKLILDVGVACFRNNYMLGLDPLPTSCPFLLGHASSTA